jgi:hypothetical protein
MKYAWLECPHCHGLYVQCSDPDFAPIDAVTPLQGSDYLKPDGTPYDAYTPVPPCQTCGFGHPTAFSAANVRRGDALPDRKEVPGGVSLSG